MSQGHAPFDQGTDPMPRNVYLNATAPETLEALEIVAVLERIAFERGRQQALAGEEYDPDALRDLNEIVESLPRSNYGQRFFELGNPFSDGRSYGQRQAAAQGLNEQEAGRSGLDNLADLMRR